MLNMIPLAQAKSIIDQLREKFQSRRTTERINIDDALDRELAEPITAQFRSPSRHKSTFDGYALKSSDQYPLRLIGKIYAGDDSSKEIQNGETMYVATGALLPEGADAVLKIEDAQIEGNLLFGKKMKQFENVLRAGTDFEEGETIFKPGHRIRAQDIGILHKLGLSQIFVFKKHTVAIISTGSEIHNNLTTNTNAPMVIAFLKEVNCAPTDLKSVPDDLELIKQKLLEGAKYDAIITIGGVSVGERDFVPKAISDLGELIFHKVQTRPGKPLAVGVINGKPVFALPGKPNGTLIAWELIVKRFFDSNHPKVVKKFRTSEDILLPKKGFVYGVFTQIKDGEAIPIGSEKSPLKVFAPGSPYKVSIIAHTLRSSVFADGYFLTDRDLNKGDEVEVILF
ncbi:MAG: molybdopterin molybdotransferase MoeA [Euryarchaeota archaeon]|nr:molybdopterin molybdotransferase MoeA [Euryarchaeota archaeon]